MQSVHGEMDDLFGEWCWIHTWNGKLGEPQEEIPFVAHSSVIVGSTWNFVQFWGMYLEDTSPWLQEVLKALKCGKLKCGHGANNDAHDIHLIWLLVDYTSFFPLCQLKRFAVSLRTTARCVVLTLVWPRAFLMFVGLPPWVCHGNHLWEQPQCRRAADCYFWDVFSLSYVFSGYWAITIFLRKVLTKFIFQSFKAHER